MNDALFSPDRVYRYKLERRIPQPFESCVGVFIMLNPSTADETVNDPTIRRCIGYAQRWGWSRLVVLNLFAFRATKPADLKRAADPWGCDNLRVIREVVTDADYVVAAWGAHGDYLRAGDEMLDKLRGWGVEPMALGFTKDGHPVHPLYQRSDAMLWPVGKPVKDGVQP